MDKIKNSDTDLFFVVWNSPWSYKSKRTWYTSEYINSLKELLHTFQFSHHKIGRLIKIPKSTFARLWREIVTQTFFGDKIIDVAEIALCTIKGRTDFDLINS